MTRTLPITCTVDGCNALQQSNGMCSKHYQRQRRTGTLQARTYEAKKHCAVEGCTENSKSRDYCVKHYHRFMRYGDPLFQPAVSSDNACTIPDCDDAMQTKGLCRNHYANYRYRRNRGDVEDIAGYLAHQAGRQTPDRKRNAPEACSQDDCDSVVVAVGLCSKHYQRRYYQNAPKTNRRSQVCRVPDCIGSVYAKNRCGQHYREQLDAIEQQQNIPVEPARKICAITGCRKQAAKHELCDAHLTNYTRLKRRHEVTDPFDYMATKNKQIQNPTE